MSVREVQVRKNSQLFAELSAALLQRGQNVQFRVNGESMRPNLLDGDDVVVAPAAPSDLRPGDLALIQNADGILLHRVRGVDPSSGVLCTASDTGLTLDLPVSRTFGKVLARHQGSHAEVMTPWRTRFVQPLRCLARRVFLGAQNRIRTFSSLLLGIALLVLLCATFLVPAAHAQADLAVTSDTAAPLSVSPGGQITYTVVVVNNGPNTAALPVVSTITPANTSFVSAAKTAGAGTWNCANPPVGGTGASTCTRTTNMGSGSTATFTVVVQVNAAVANGTIITNSVNISSTTADPAPANNTAGVSVTVQAPDLSMTQTAAPNPVTAGANITYTETVTNNGPTAANGVTLKQNTPANTTFVSVAAATGWTCGTMPSVGGTGAITCTANAAIASGTTSTNFTIVVAVSAATVPGTNITNTAAVSETGTDPTPANNTTTSTVTLALADLQLLQTASVTAVAVSTNYTYTEVVTNNGPTSVGTGTVIVYQQTPPNTNFQGYAGINWTCTNPGAGNAGPIICTYNAALPSSASASALTITMQVNAGTASGTTIQNSATVTSSTIDSIPANNTSVTSILVEPTTTSDLAVSMSVSPTPVFIFSNLVYNIQVENLGQATAPVTANVLSDTLPAGVTLVSVTATAGWSCSGSTTISCSITTAMAANSTASIAITVTAPAAATTLTNTATATLAGDPNASNNSAASYTVVQPLVCATPGRDGAGGTLTGVVNTYFPPASAGSLSSGATAVTLGASSGAGTGIAAGDLLLIIQMQGAAINSTNTSSYGDGLAGDPASGSTSLGRSGLFEFVTASTAVSTAGGTLQFVGTGPSGGLLNSYSSVVATTTQAQQTFQMIRVPQYTSATLSSGLVPLTWNGKIGGVLVLDVSSQLTLGGTVALDALGFRGGAGRQLGGGTGAVSDYVAAATNAANGSKGEGIAGTPRYLAPQTITTASTAIDTTGGTPTDTLPGGSYARGAPGNAGGGGTDGHPAGNDYNSGGGAGSNGGTGGQGGYGWNSLTVTNTTDGGFGGAVFPASTSALVMGGAGGAGTTNNGTYYISSASNGNGNGIFSSGGAGGGIAIIHAGSVTGTGTITANGQSTLSTLNDSTGGGGAGGSILILANSGSLSGLTVNAIGGSAGNAWPTQAPGGFPGERHGPGGGGGGGVIFLSATPASSNVAGGANGYTDSVQDSYGATPGQAGQVVSTHIITETPGTQSGAYCAGTDLSVTNSGSPSVVTPGGNITYTQGVNNNGPLDAVNAVFSEAIPANTTFQSIVPAAGWICTTTPAIGATGNISCSNPDFAAGGRGTFTVVVQVATATPSGTQIVDVDNITAGTSDPNLANNSAAALTTVSVATSADLLITNAASALTVNAGSNVTMTAVVTNQGPAAATSVGIIEATPANTTFVSLAPPAGWACGTLPPVGGTGNIVCAIASLAAGTSATFPIVLNVNSGTAAGMTITDTVTVASASPDSNPTNNTATATTVVATAGQVDLGVSSSASPNPVTEVNNISYTQSVTNYGTAIETNATFTDTIPTNTTLVSFVPPLTWTCNPIAVGGTGTFTCTLNAGQTIAVGASVNFPLVVKVNGATAPGTIITNSASVASTVGDPNPGNNTAPTFVTVASPTQADVSITKTASPEPVNQGTNLAYTLQVTNGGPAIAQNVSVTDILPAQVTYTSVFTNMGTCTYTAATTTVSCSLGSLGVGSVAVITINVTAVTFSSASLSSNTAIVSSPTSDPDLRNNSSIAITAIQAPTAVDISSFEAFQQTDGTVVLEWRTHEESRNLGFHIYREGNSGKQRITPSLVAGSALLLRGSKPQHAAKFYRWVDTQASSGASYWIEDVDVNGTRTMHGPAHVEAQGADHAASSFASVQASPLLRELRPSVRTAPVFAGSRALVTPQPVFPAIPANISRTIVADHPAVKIAVNHEGWYHVSFAQLVAAGFDLNIDLRSLHLFAEGVEQPLLLTAASGRSASASDGIEFYGTGIDTPFSDQRIYWLVRENQTGKRILPVPSPPSGSASPESFPFSVNREDRTTYFAALLNGEDNDNFFGAVITSDPVDQELFTAHVDSSSSLPVSLELALQGATDQQDHRISVQFNGADLGQMEFSGLTLAKQSFPVVGTLLHDGTNTVTLTALNGDNDVSVVQSIEFHYAHTFAADADWLRATAPAGSELHLAGFSNASVRVFDITDILNITELTPKVAANSGSFTATLALSASGPDVRTILAFASDAVSTPVSLTRHVPTFLDDRRAGGDIVIITHPDFADSLAPLVRHRESQGHQVALVTTEQIYDEYNNGERSPFAIRSFLTDAAAHWQRKPQALLLVGDASFDPRNYLGLGDFDFVPTRLIETAAFKTGSDDWFSDLQQTGYATLATGRLPVRSAADAQLLVSRIINYERGSFAGTWNGQSLMVGDQNVDANFSSAVSSASANLPALLKVSKILANELDSATARSQIIAALNNGALLVDYQGHGAEQQWSFADLFDSTDAAALTNGGRLPLYLLMDCLNGFFQDVYAESLAESILLAPNGGGIAVWASSGFTDQAPQASMNQSFLHQFSAHPKMPIGWLVQQTKAGTSDNDVRRTWILFGDPSLTLQIAPSAVPAALPDPPRRGDHIRESNPACARGSVCSKVKEIR